MTKEQKRKKNGMNADFKSCECAYVCFHFRASVLLCVCMCVCVCVSVSGMSLSRVVIGLFALVAVACFVSAVSATIYFKEEFKSGWDARWVESDVKRKEGTAGVFKWTAGQWYGDAEEDKGIQTSADARFYGISAKMSDTPISNEGKDLVLQFSVKHEQDLDCGGAYIKILPAGLDQKAFSGDSSYNVMFGPDKCGYSKNLVHMIFNYKGKNLLWKKEPRAESDRLSHIYTMVLHPDNSYELYIDLEKKESGKLEDGWDFLLPKEIDDPSAKKPEDWVDDEMMDDPEDKRPEDWDKVPEKIVDPEAKKPEDWDDEEDGEWQPPMIPNPQYKGEWKPRRIKNPAYKGPWKAPRIPNPDYVADDKLYLQKDMQYVGFELWQVKSGTIFDNIIVADNFDEAKAFAEATWSKNKDKERDMYNRLEDEKRKKEEEQRKRDEEAQKAKEAEEKEKEPASSTSEASDSSTSSSSSSTSGSVESQDEDAKSKARRAKLDEMKHDEL